ncbi:MAG: RNA polymerase sigma factor [candidate division WOR-3 bacterium]
MSHLSTEEILGYLDGDKSIVDIKKASKHLDGCERCTSHLKDSASISILLELITMKSKERREKEILGRCPDVEMMFNFIENRLSKEKRMKMEKHLKQCEYCQEGLKVIQTTEEISEAEIPEMREPERFLPKILHYFELYFVAYEREKAIAKKKKFRIPGFETIRKIILPRRLTLVPLGFAELMKRDSKFYSQLNDGQLMQACKQGDNMAWSELERRFRNYAYTIIAAHHLKEKWEDVWQESLIALASSINEYKERGKAKYFLREIIINKCRKIRKSEIKEEKVITLIVNKMLQKSLNSESLEILKEKENVQRLVGNIKKMPEKFSSILTAFLDGYNDKEIAQLLDIPVETVRSRKFRSRLKFIEMKLNDEEFLSKIKRLEWVKRNFYKLFSTR